MNDETRTIEFKNLNQLKDHINEKAEKLRENANEFNALLKSSFGEFPRDALSLVQFIEKVIDLREAGKNIEEGKNDRL